MMTRSNNNNNARRRSIYAAGGLYLLCLMNGKSSFLLPEVAAAVPCNATPDDRCDVLLRPGSVCVNGECSNPYTSGCLFNQMKGWTRKRVCNSEDPPDSGLLGICRPPKDGFDYTEIRIASQNWESVFFEAWVLQILLSEVLDVPTTLESGVVTAKINFYDPTSPFDFGEGNVFDALQTSVTVGGDCRLVPKGTTPDTYIPCAHIIPEVWGGHEAAIKNMTLANVIEPATFIGVIGQEGWFLPQMTARRDPTLMSYYGMSGEENRRKLADRFLRPTTWDDYCQQVSANRCAKPDGVAKRAPVDSTERDRMFVDGLYTGHFRKTEENDCDKWPHNCTGHIIDYPCDWASYVGPQTYWLNISLKSSGKNPSGGYAYEQILEIWQAANATQSDIVGMLWYPHALYQSFLHTNTQMEFVTMPPADYVCVNARMNPDARCSGTLAEKVGKPEGVCSDPPISLLKLISTSLYSKTNDPSINSALHSPGYEAVKSFRMNNIELSEIFDHWLHAVDQQGFGPREATCQWVIDNFDTVLGLVPRTYPRVLRQNTDIRNGAFFKVALSFGVIAITVVLASCFVTFRQRERKVIKYAQIEFMLLLLIGLLMVSSASIIQAVLPTNARCVSVIWLVNLGYTLELVPLIVKVAAINRLMQAAQKMKRIQLTRKRLFGAVFLLCALVMAFLVLWTVLDPPRRVTDYVLTEQETSEGQTIVTTDYYCKSSSPAWIYSSVGAQCFLLLCASALAFQTRKMRKDMNETQTLAVLIYSHFMFVTMRIAAIMLQGTLNVSVVSEVLSLIYSVDSMATVAIYFVPKFLWDHLAHDADTEQSNLNSVAQFRRSVDPLSVRPYNDSLSRPRGSSEESAGGFASHDSSKFLRKGKKEDMHVIDRETSSGSHTSIPGTATLQAKSEASDGSALGSASAMACSLSLASDAEKATNLQCKSEASDGSELGRTANATACRLPAVSDAETTTNVNDVSRRFGKLLSLTTRSPTGMAMIKNLNSFYKMYAFDLVVHRLSTIEPVESCSVCKTSLSL